MVEKKNNYGLLCDVGELIAALSGSHNIDTFLSEIVSVVAAHLRAPVASIYVFEEDTESLVLKANHGLNPELIGKVRLKNGEGLVGTAMAELRPICMRNASQHEAYKHFEGLDEEAYDSFLAIPISHAGERIGVLVAQRDKRHPFRANDVMTLRATASQLAGALETTKTIFAMHRRDESSVKTDPLAELSVLDCQIASEGFVLAECAVLDPDKAVSDAESGERHFGLDDFDRALETTIDQLESLQASMEQQLTEMASLIFTAHLLMLKDDEFVGEMRKRIEDGEEATEAVLGVARGYMNLFANSPNAYMAEKANDIEDLGKRLVANILGADNGSLVSPRDRVVIARDMFPSAMLELTSEGAAGVVLVSGGVTSHLSILARSLQLPMLIVDNSRLLRLPNHTKILLDAEVGRLYVDPTDDVIDEVRKHHMARELVAKQQAKPKDATHTVDGTQVHLMANINLISDLDLAKEMKLEGVGLYRTEFPFMIHSDFPSEEEQYVIYRHLIKEMAGCEVTIRTLDIGGDKVLAYYDNAKEANPFLGLRSIRFSLRHKSFFQQQIRAILRAGADCENLRIMFPMISSADEFLIAKNEVLTCIDELSQEEQEHHHLPEIGMMIEIPSVVEIIDDMAALADFFCIGTNDFIQFLLAVDRTNEKVASYFLPHHPAVLRALNKIISTAQHFDIDVSICGEMAHEERYIPFLLGIGARTLSVDPRYGPRMQQFIEKLNLEAVQQHGKRMLDHGTIAAVERELETFFDSLPDSQPQPTV
jgi:phosphotransferase system enzyme I (PtsP)